MVECIINASGGNTQQKNPFGTQQQLQNRKIIAIETFNNQDVTNSPITTSNPVIPFNIFQASFLTMYTAAIPAGAGKPGQAEGLYFDQLPLCMFRRQFNANNLASAAGSGGGELFRIRPTEMSWTKCYVSIPTPVSMGSATSYSMLLLVHYLDINDDGHAYM